MREVRGLKRARALDIERLAIYDFFAANPFLLFARETTAGTRLTLAGFNSRSLGYQSSFHRFATRRGRLRADLSRLVALGLVETLVQDGKIAFAVNEPGLELADKFASLYSQSYRESAATIATELNKLSDKRLRDNVGEWLQAKAFLIDLFDARRAE
jgi:hypothetical protein